jgi:hypothetical protein
VREAGRDRGGEVVAMTDPVLLVCSRCSRPVVVERGTRVWCASCPGEPELWDAVILARMQADPPRAPSPGLDAEQIESRRVGVAILRAYREQRQQRDEPEQEAT